MPEGEPSNKRQIAFRPRARLVSVLGEQLISDQAVGLIELVKNAYDADATEVVVELRDLRDPKRCTVIVRDNGSGMSRRDVEERWLSPAVDHKERDKKADRRTPLGRLPIGEKGVGRFAVQQMGRTVELVARNKMSPFEVRVSIDWDVFEKENAFLDTVRVTIEERRPTVFKSPESGTLIVVNRPRVPWTRPLVEKVHRTLRRLQSPLKEEKGGFRVTLRCPDFPEYENTDSTDILSRAHYEFQAAIQADGECEYEYHCRHPALAPREKSGSQNLVALAGKELQGAVPACGPFWLNLYVWDRTKDYLAQAGVSARELTAQSGVSVFRDGLRVLPYGEPGDDWLLLDQERIQDPSGRIGNNQVIGQIEVFQENNLRLRDKTSREGLIENEAFLDLRAMARAAIRLFTTHWKKDRPKEESVRRKLGSLEIAREVATALRDSASEGIQVEVPVPAAERADGAPKEEEEEEDGGIAHVSGWQFERVSQRRAAEILLENIDGAAASVDERQQRLDRLLSLAATGLAAERVVHEFGRQVSAALEALGNLRRILSREDRQGPEIDVLESCLGTLKNEFRILAPFDAVARPDRPREFSVYEAANLAVTINRKFLEDNRVQTAIRGPEFKVTARLAPIVQVLDNLVNNACYWLGTLPAGVSRPLEIILDSSQRRVVVQDGGPGVLDEARPHLFEPFFSMKPGGTGLGLYISKEILRRMSASIRLAASEDLAGLGKRLGGAAFVVEFMSRAPRGDTSNGGTG